jgi:hypothetical protein
MELSNMGAYVNARRNRAESVDVLGEGNTFEFNKNPLPLTTNG